MFRLSLGPDGSVTAKYKGFWPPSNPFHVGDVWELDLISPNYRTLPHSEDMIVNKINFKKKSLTTQELYEFLISNINRLTPCCVWKGWPWELYNRLLTSSRKNNGSGYCIKQNPPKVSTGFWIPNRDLVLQEIQIASQLKKKRVYNYQGHKHHFGIGHLSYVGEATSVERIPAGSLIRVSLTRWITLSHYPEASWLMMSGWYGEI